MSAFTKVSGDKEAYFNQYRDAVRRGVNTACFEACGAYADVRADLVQEVWAYILGTDCEWDDNYVGTGEYENYLRRCVKNYTIDLLRSGDFTSEVFCDGAVPIEDCVDTEATIGWADGISLDGSLDFRDLAWGCKAAWRHNPVSSEQQADWDRRCTVTDEDREWGIHENAMERMRAADERNYGDAQPSASLHR